MNSIITKQEYMQNKKVLDLVETSNLLMGPFRKAFYLKSNLLRDLGFKTILYNGNDIPLNSASFHLHAETIHNHLRGAFYVAGEENRIYDLHNVE
ncbi:MAG: hypothetical protein KKF48_00695 [Nanoarchaeota archaeon]|nr:hypothetical protein [Nanoarchaeota archaeon]MBU1027541.1 hypothetical protein [Nanoarchaeota archaeon]